MTTEHESEQEQVTRAAPPDEGARQAEAAETPEAGAGAPASREGASPAPAGDGDDVSHDLDELIARAEKADQYLALAQRTQADFENFRKRMVRDAAATEARGVAKLAKELLPALDNLGRALEAADAAEDDQPEHHLTSGIRLVHDELSAALHRVGIEAFSPQGERFDPNEHEAMAQQPVEGAESGTVVAVYQRGYKLDGMVLRPARVVVAA